MSIKVVRKEIFIAIALTTLIQLDIDFLFFLYSSPRAVDWYCQ